MAPSSSPSSHHFRYEQDLCSMAEGQTLAQWRCRNRSASASAHPGRRGRRVAMAAALRLASRRNGAA